MARMTNMGTDYIVLSKPEEIENEKENHTQKVHLIELDFSEPDEIILKKVISTFSETRRYVISNFVRFYNNQFKKYMDKKFYVKNVEGDNLLIFLKRNNKVLLDFTVLSDIEQKLIFNDLGMILEYVEVVKISKKEFENHFKIFKNWKGNVIIN